MGGLERRDAAVFHARQVGHITFPCRQVVGRKLVQVGVAAGPGHDSHQSDCRSQETIQFFCAHLRFEPGSEVFLLGRDTGRAVVGVTRACGHATYGLDRGVGDRDARRRRWCN
jgi:hypothetical protein